MSQDSGSKPERVENFLENTLNLSQLHLLEEPRSLEKSPATRFEGKNHRTAGNFHGNFHFQDISGVQYQNPAIGNSFLQLPQNLSHVGASARLGKCSIVHTSVNDFYGSCIHTQQVDSLTKELQEFRKELRQV